MPVATCPKKQIAFLFPLPTFWSCSWRSFVESQSWNPGKLWNYFTYLTSLSKKISPGWLFPSGVLSIQSRFTLNRSCFLDIWQCRLPTSPILLIICSQSCRGGGLQGRSVGYPSCQSNVRAVRGVADLVWKVLLVIKISHGGWVLISEKLSVFPQLSCCLHACCHVWTTPQARWNQGRQLSSAIMRKQCDDDRNKEVMVFQVALVNTVVQPSGDDSGLKNTDN